MNIRIHTIHVNSISNIGSLNVGKTMLLRNTATSYKVTEDPGADGALAAGLTPGDAPAAAAAEAGAVVPAAGVDTSAAAVTTAGAPGSVTPDGSTAAQADVSGTAS